MTFSIDNPRGVATLGKYVWEKPSGEQGLNASSVCTSEFCQGHALLRVCLWNGDSLLWGDCQCSYTGALSLVDSQDLFEPSA